MGNWNNLTGPRQGLALHYTAGSYVGSVAWCQDPASKVSYQWILAQDGRSTVIAPWNKRAWHMGVCKTSDPINLPYKDANSCFEGLALAASDGDVISDIAGTVLLDMIRGRFAANKWDLSETWRIVGHDAEAWPRGRKHDPTGTTGTPVIDVAKVRAAL